MFAVSPGQTGVAELGRYEGTDLVGFAGKRMPGWRSVFCGALQISPEVLRGLARSAGVHIYSDANDVVMGGEGFLAVHATTGGEKTLTLPQAAGLQDLGTGETMPPARVHRYRMTQGDTRLFALRGGR